MAKLHSTNECSGDRRASDQNIVNRCCDRFARDPKAARRVSLRIAVNEKGSLLGGSEAGGEIDGSRRFSDTTFLVGDRDGSGHGAQGRGAGNIGASQPSWRDVSRGTSPSSAISTRNVSRENRAEWVSTVASQSLVWRYAGAEYCLLARRSGLKLPAARDANANRLLPGLDGRRRHRKARGTHLRPIDRSRPGVTRRQFQQGA